jgi:hypothetical protein
MRGGVITCRIINHAAVPCQGAQICLPRLCPCVRRYDVCVPRHRPPRSRRWSPLCRHCKRGGAGLEGSENVLQTSDPEQSQQHWCKPLRLGPVYPPPCWPACGRARSRIEKPVCTERGQQRTTCMHTHHGDARITAPGAPIGHAIPTPPPVTLTPCAPRAGVKLENFVPRNKGRPAAVSRCRPPRR